jgi:DNA primase
LLASPDAMNYLALRGLKKEFIIKFQLGYSKKSNNELLEIMKKKYNENYRLLFDSGVFRKSSYSKDFYNILQNRIIFPIFDKFGRVIAFSGRVFGEKTSGPKYINCSDSLIFKKSENLYGENLAIKNIKNSGHAILVEGNLDVIMMHQVGFENVVASLGTAISDIQLKYLWSHCDEIKCIFDGDLAGYKAMIATIEKGLQVIQAGKFLSFVNLPKDSDPASLIIQNGEQEMAKLILKSKFASEMILRVIWLKYKNLKIEHIAAIKKNLNYYLNLINDEIIRKEYQNYFDKKLREIGEFAEKNSVSNFSQRWNPKKINISNPLYEKIFCFSIVFLNKFNHLNEFIDSEFFNEIYYKSLARQKLENMLKLSLKEIFIQNFQKIDMNFVKYQFRKEGLGILADYIENSEQEIQFYEKDNLESCKKLWLKNVDLSIIQSKIAEIELKGNPSYESNKELHVLHEKEKKIKQNIEE